MNIWPSMVCISAFPWAEFEEKQIVLFLVLEMKTWYNYMYLFIKMETKVTVNYITKAALARVAKANQNT